MTGGSRRCQFRKVPGGGGGVTLNSYPQHLVAQHFSPNDRGKMGCALMVRILCKWEATLS